MGRTVAELERALSHSEWVEWCALAEVDPWGEARADMRAAQVAWAAGASQFFEKPPELGDLLLDFSRCNEPDEDELERRLDAALDAAEARAAAREKKQQRG